jgi:enoyl-CoA hydratase/carnithine racemase
MNESTGNDAGVLTQLLGDVFVVQLSNPRRANAITEGMLEELAGVLRGPGPREARMVLLGGGGDRHFSSGLDLSGDGDLDSRLRAGERLLGEAACAIEECATPVVAVLAGAVMGGALELAVACDWRIAAPSARLAMPAGRLGVVYTAEGLVRFLAILGPARTRMLFATGEPVRASEALALGLVDHVVVDDDALWPRARESATEVAGMAPLSVGGVREVIAALARGDREGAERLAAERREAAFGSEDFQEGLAAFRERRAPRFRGL